jgi:hypothetical protein
MHAPSAAASAQRRATGFLVQLGVPSGGIRVARNPSALRHVRPPISSEGWHMKKHKTVAGAAVGAVTAAVVLGAIQAYGTGVGSDSTVGTHAATATHDTGARHDTGTGHDTKAGEADLNALAARISADMHRWDGTFALRKVVVDGSGYVSVGVDDPEKAEPLIKRAFGEKHIKVEHVEQAHLFK